MFVQGDIFSLTIMPVKNPASISYCFKRKIILDTKYIEQVIEYLFWVEQVVVFTVYAGMRTIMPEHDIHAFLIARTGEHHI